jgi:hypothetical protein
MIKHFKKYELGVNDCWDLIVDIFQDSKMVKNCIELPRFPYFTEDKKPEFQATLFDILKINKLDKPEREALILFKGNHIGFCLNDKKFIHRLKECNTRMDSISDWEKRIVGIYSLEGKKSS